MSHWDPALNTLQDAEDGIIGPESFIGYLQRTGQNPDNFRTAAELSIDTRQQLPNRLAENETMILRLGRATDGPGTQFALVNVPGRLDDFFIRESEFTKESRQVLDYSLEGNDTLGLPQSAQDMLDVYRSLPNFSETSFVNFALATGLISRTFSLDSEQIGTAPTTIATTFDFKFEPHPERPTVLHHNGGQVEIDALIKARRAGESILLVIEAKSGGPQDLAKHKLGYPALAASTLLSFDVDRIMPVYLRAQATDDAIQYSLYECSPLPPGDTLPTLAGIQVTNYHHYTVQLDELE